MIGNNILVCKRCGVKETILTKHKGQQTYLCYCEGGHKPEEGIRYVDWLRKQKLNRIINKMNKKDLKNMKEKEIKMLKVNNKLFVTYKDYIKEYDLKKYVNYSSNELFEIIKNNIKEIYENDQTS